MNQRHAVGHKIDWKMHCQQRFEVQDFQQRNAGYTTSASQPPIAIINRVGVTHRKKLQVFWNKSWKCQETPRLTIKFRVRKSLHGSNKSGSRSSKKVKHRNHENGNNSTAPSLKPQHQWNGFGSSMSTMSTVKIKWLKWPTGTPEFLAIRLRFAKVSFQTVIWIFTYVQNAPKFRHKVVLVGFQHGMESPPSARRDWWSISGACCWWSSRSQPWIHRK